MPGLGTIVNIAAVIAGGLIGVLFGKKINNGLRDSMMNVLGLAVLFIGAAGALSKLLAIGSDGKLETYGALMMIISLVVGTLFGEILKIEDKLEVFGIWLKKKVHAKEEGFVSAFVNTSLVICVGAMAVVGSIEDGLTGNHTTLFAKALLDFLIVIIMSSTLGIGCMFAFIPIGILQGSVTALSRFCEPVLRIGNVIGDMSLVGSVLIFCVGVNLAFGKKFKVGNMLPALIVAVLYSCLEFYIKR